MKLIAKYKHDIPPNGGFNTLSLGEVAEIPKPNDIISYIGKQWKVLDTPKIWDLEFGWAKEKSVMIEVEKIQ